MKNNHVKSRFYLHILCAFVVLSLFFSVSVFAQGNLLIYPKRVVFDGKQRSQEITLANTGRDSARYVISFVQNRMTADGSLETITQPDPGQQFADPYLRIFPRSVTLAPNESQTVKVQVSNANTLQQGEYRSHLYFRAVPSEAKRLGSHPEEPETAGVSVRLTAVFGIGIPVIIRSGTSTAQVSITRPSLENPPSAQRYLQATLNREGNMSSHGDLRVEHISEAGQVTPVGLIRGISIYTPNTARTVQVKLSETSGINYQKGKLNIYFTAPVEERSVTLASAELILNHNNQLITKTE